MSEKTIRVVHYINQFFGGIGGEDKAGVPPESRAGAVGPGLALQAALGQGGKIVGTVICGDNYFNESMDAAIQQVLELIQKFQPDVIIAGPAFNSGRNGLACGRVCQAAVEDLHIPAVTGLFPENAAVELYRRWAIIVPTASNTTGLKSAVAKMADLALRLGAGQTLRSPEEEGYLSQGRRKNGFADRTAAERALDMLLTKLRGGSFRTELPLPAFDHVAAPLLKKPLAEATIALVTEGGIVPLGNPDRIESGWATRWARYDISHLDDLTSATHESIHGGYDTTFANQDPDRVVPLDVMRILEQQGRIGHVYKYYYATAGMAGPVANATRFGREIGQELVQAGVDAVLLVAT